MQFDGERKGEICSEDGNWATMDGIEKGCAKPCSLDQQFRRCRTSLELCGQLVIRGIFACVSTTDRTGDVGCPLHDSGRS